MDAKREAESKRLAERSADEVRGLASGEFDSNIAAKCGDMDSRALALWAPMVRKAAEYGLAGAAHYLILEGPTGNGMTDFVNRPYDPMVVQWRERMADLLRLAARKGDISASQGLSNMYADGDGIIGKRDPKLALQYGAAAYALYEQKNGKPLLGKKENLGRLSAPLSADVAKQALDDGIQMAQAAMGAAK